MTTYPPEPIVIDLEAEGEFLTDDQPNPSSPTGGVNSSNGAGGDKPGLGVRLAAGAQALARREYTALREGLTVLKTETKTWANASEETAAHLRAGLLNRRYNTWLAQKNAEVERLEEKAGELEKQARRATAAGQADEASTADHKQATTTAAALHQEAAAWRERARDIQRRPYTGHHEPVDTELERHRRRTANKRWAGLATLTLAVGGLEIAAGSLFLPTFTAAAIAVVAWAKGRITGWRRTLPDVPALAYEIATGTPAKEKKNQQPEGPAAAFDGALFPGDTGRPFSIRDVTDPAVAAECVRRALLAERVPLAHVGEPVQQPWGWEVVVRVSEGTSGEIGDKLGGLETRFDLGDGDVILQPNRQRTSEATLRIVTGDLFGAMKPAPYRAPHSVDITTAGVFGMSADGTDLCFSLAELMGEVIARSGGGKSTLIRALLDWTTAAHNAVTVFLDPSGDGPGKFTDAVKLTSTNPIQIEFALLSLYRLAAGRARIRRKLGMGDTWRCSREHPAVFAFIDEFPKLTKRSKQIIAELMLVGRKEGVWVLFAAQGATKELLGSNIAQHPALKIVGACRDVDTTQALGSGSIDFGYLPHRLQPKSGTSLNDCAKSYIVGAPGVSEDPMLHKWHYIPDDEGGRRAAERLAAGLVDVDQASIDAALNAPNPPSLKFGDDEDEYLHYVPWPRLLAMCAEDDDEYSPESAAGQDEEQPLPEIVQVLLDALDAEQAEALTLVQLHPYLIAHDAKRWDRWHEKDERGRVMEIGRTLSLEVRRAGVELSTERLDEVDGSPRGIRRSDVLAAADQYTESPTRSAG
ncbi:hypothetical protein [Kitasatospora griseola]|uniref:hypothetical protein n=1 Tax=Kitasatospora griseola TaxID=2064 RepID=UPI001670795C|nr:hypothetical protein [Kitasatospora griseola]GGR04366.1 hypothetical protein GCM10010195_69810 [Kitasatospora griseola]